jgi:hypothetical protein
MLWGIALVLLVATALDFAIMGPHLSVLVPILVVGAVGVQNGIRSYTIDQESLSLEGVLGAKKIDFARIRGFGVASNSLLGSISSAIMGAPSESIVVELQGWAHRKAQIWVEQPEEFAAGLGEALEAWRQRQV